MPAPILTRLCSCRIFWGVDNSKGQEDCSAVFGDSDDFQFARVACDIRTWTYIVGIILLLVAALGPIIIGLFGRHRRLVNRGFGWHPSHC